MGKIKAKSTYFCKECGYESAGWLGKCPACSEWNTFVEEKVQNSTKNQIGSMGFNISPKMNDALPVGQIQQTHEIRSTTGISELDRVLGGGVVQGSIILAAGDPGIGKSTMMLMISGYIAMSNIVLYVSGEESANQVKMRAQRLGVTAENLYIYSETSLESILNQIQKINPKFVIIDSVQTIFDDSLDSPPGSVSQVREITGTLMRLAKTSDITIFIVGHVTKEGSIAGPRVLEHMVDTVLYFEGERNLSYRILRSIKNRFGSTNEIGVFEMRDTGLKEVPNPSVALLQGRAVDTSGTAVVCTMEGTRPMLIEVQALVSNTNLTMPRRMTTGFDHNRLSMLIAVLEKKLGLRMYECDAYINIIGGIRLDESACDLGIAAALISSYKNIICKHDIAYIGEIGLAGEIRAVSHIEKRIHEIFRLGFKACVIPEGNEKAAFEALKKMPDPEEYVIYSISNINGLFQYL